MSFNINEFVSSLSNSGVANPADFKVIITPPQAVENNDAASMTMRCDQVDFPGRAITFVDYNVTGMPWKVGMSASQPDINISVILSADFREKLFFEKWQDKIVGPYRNGQTAGNMFNVGYYKDYIGTINMMQYDAQGEVVYECKLIDAYPVVIGNILGDWQSTNAIHKLPVTIAYRYFADTNSNGTQTQSAPPISVKG